MEEDAIDYAEEVHNIMGLNNISFTISKANIVSFYLNEYQSFPSKEKIKQIIEFCKKYIKCDVEELNNKLDKERKLDNKKLKEYRLSQSINKVKLPVAGYIYFLQDDKNRIKIGKTINLNNRIFNLGLVLPKKPKLYHSIISSNITKDERYFHNKYSKFRLEGEWFKLPKKELEKIKAVKEICYE